ncbi:MAG: TlpA family protein disulfide reductase [Saprospiraceae bacterium]|nr:TlpA family protein disulfide reductase [Saprospiraceae bacterium]
MKQWIFFGLFVISICTGCVAPNQTFEKIPPGIWRGTLLLDRVPVSKYGDDRDIVKKFDFDAELPFNFEVIYDDASNFHVVIHNAEERIKITDIEFGRDKSTAKDTVVIRFPVYDTYIKAIYEDGVMEGEWVVNYRENYSIPFKAVHGVADRFSLVDGEVETNVDGRWSATFEIGTDDQYPATGLFRQEEKRLTGTFLTETGDYRYLEGIVYKKKIYLSTFDGAHAYLFLGKLMDNGQLTGTYRSGSHYTTNWEAVKDKEANLHDAYDLTKSNTSDPLSLSFENESGTMVSIDDDKYKNKIKLIQLMGTWCPNCMDETVFLKTYFEKHPADDVEIISIGFERYKDAEKAKASLKRFKTRMNIDHEVLYGGHYDKKAASEKMPQLDKIMAYPTLLFVDRNNRIVKIHTGFNGLATPEYPAFEKEFGEIIESMRK